MKMVLGNLCTDMIKPLIIMVIMSKINHKNVHNFEKKIFICTSFFKIIYWKLKKETALVDIKRLICFVFL